MRRFLLDTGPAQDFNHDRNGIRGRVQAEGRRGNRIGIGTPVLGELWAGLGGSESRERKIHRLHLGLSRLIPVSAWERESPARSRSARWHRRLTAGTR
jgi:hypothetical protein